MATDDQDKLEQIYSAALRLDSDQRPEFVRQECGKDKALRAEVESLLAHDQALGSFSGKARRRGRDYHYDRRIACRRCARPLSLAAENRRRRHGRGLAGRAKRNRSAGAFALKLVKAGMNTRVVLARFESERQALAAQLRRDDLSTAYDRRGPLGIVIEYMELGHATRSLVPGRHPRAEYDDERCASAASREEQRPDPALSVGYFSGALLVYSCQARKRGGPQNVLSAPADHHLVQFPGSDGLGQIIVHSCL